MNRYLYLAYGSNLNVRQMRYRCPGAAVVGTTELKGYSLRFRGSKSGNYLTVEKEKGGTVPVAVWAVSEENLKHLDMYEGYPTFYRREKMKISLDGQTLEAIIYIMNDVGTYGWPSKSYMITCLEGYQNFRFKSRYLYEALEKTKELKDNG